MRHKPVLLKEVIENLNLKDSNVFVDCTLGSAGHSQAVCKLGLNNLTIVGLDKDSDAIERSAKHLDDCRSKVILENLPNKMIDQALEKNGIEKVNAVLIDLGISSEQLDISGRGFTFQKDEPLFMTMKKSPEESDLTAEIILNTFSKEVLADIIFGYGEERYARRIAEKIIEFRKLKPIKTTFDLVEIVKSATPSKYHKGKTHPATKTFQAIRIAVNDEVESLTITLNKSFEALENEGRILVISFHSIEDRIVKHWMNEKEKQGVAKKVYKKPMAPTEEEIKNNPRSRSSKLRILEKQI